MFDFNLEFARNGAYLTVELFRELAKDTSNQNLVFSPFSVQHCVALAFAGAMGETAEEIATGLRFVSSHPPEVAKTFKFVLDQYHDNPLLKIANKMYVMEGQSIKQDYLNITKENYHAEAELVNFKENVCAAKTINSWVEGKTAGKIKDLVTADSLNNDTRLVLINALHFKGFWKHKFNESDENKSEFWISENESISITYMHLKATLDYGFFEDLECTALEMPYENSDLSMFVLLPNEREGLKKLAEKLKDINLVDLSERMYSEKVMVKFPKFKVDFSMELSEPLKKLGINKMFSDTAEFDNILESSDELYVSKILHKASIEVNEEGSEAAAGSGMIMQTRMMLLSTQFHADRPFIYMIWNKKNILFAGALFDVSEA